MESEPRWIFRFTVDVEAPNEAQASDFFRWVAYNAIDQYGTEIRRVERQGQIAQPIVSDGEVRRHFEQEGL